MKKILLILFLAIGITGPLAFPQTSGPELEITTEKIFELGKGDILFSSLDSVCEDAQKNVYVLDRMASKIYKFSPDGKLLLSFGSKGQGPGEFQAPYNIFDLAGNFLGSASLAEQSLYISDQFIYSIFYDEEDNFLLQKFQYQIVH